MAGFDHVGLVEIDPDACRTLRHNRPHWNVIEQDLRTFDATPFREKVDLLAGGVPCPPFSRAGLKLGELDERDLFPEALRVIAECRPNAVMLENVKGLLAEAFRDYRRRIDRRLCELGYIPSWKLLHASDYGVPQLRPRAVCVALLPDHALLFRWPEPFPGGPPTVGDSLYTLMASGGWEGAVDWVPRANRIAPTLVGGSKKHGGPDLGPTQARQAWAQLGVNGGSIAEDAPQPGFAGMPRLTVQMAAAIQGFPVEWHLTGKKTAAYRQVGNAFPPPVAAAVASSISHAIGVPDCGQIRQPRLLETSWNYEVTNAAG
jgi:DNA (cytosine-5)-methyltransferase 1